MRLTSLVFNLFATGILIACGGATARPAAPSPAAEPPTPTFSPRIVRQDRGTDWTRSDVEVAGRGRRVITSIGDLITIVDPEIGIAWDSERIEQLLDVELDPTFSRLCVTSGEASAPRVGVLDVATRTWAWSRPIEPAVPSMRVIATHELCVVQVREERGDRLIAFDLATGAPRAIDAPPFDPPSPGERHVLWSRDLARRHDRLLSELGRDPGWMVDLRDGATLARRQTFWANCIDASGSVDRIGLHEGESAERRAYLARTVEAEWIECGPPARRAGASSEPVLPAPWIALADGRLVHHGEQGLFVFDWAARRSPVQLAMAPVLRYRDANGMQRPVEPVVADGWVGAIDAQGMLQRWDLSGTPLAPIALPSGAPGTDPYDTQWQVFGGPGDRLVAIRDVRAHRTLFVSGPEGWLRSRARVFSGIWQHAASIEDRWLLSDPHRGIQLLDPERGDVLAAFSPPDSYSRISHAARSPDGARLGVIVGPWGSDGAEGVYVLDARTLAVLAHHPGDRRLYDTHSMIDWDARGIVIATRIAGTIAGPVWVAIDPESGALRTLGVGSPRSTWGYRRTGDVHVWRTAEGEALVAIGAIDDERATVSIHAGEGAVELADGHLWCEGAACDRYRCIVDPDTAAPIDHPACAGLR